MELVGDEEKMVEIELRPARVIYDDLAEVEDVSKEELLMGSYDLKRMEVYGLCYQDARVTRVMWHHDVTDDTENTGIIIPNTCIVQLDWLIAEESEGNPLDALGKPKIAN